MKTNEELAKQAGIVIPTRFSHDRTVNELNRFAALVEQRLIAKLLEGVGEPAFDYCLYSKKSKFEGSESVGYTTDQVAAAVLPYKQDAERYRWLREQNANLEEGFYVGNETDALPEDITWVGCDLDAAIDAVIRGATT